MMMMTTMMMTTMMTMTTVACSREIQCEASPALVRTPHAYHRTPALTLGCCGSAEVNDISWSPDGRRLVTCSLSSEVFVWDIFANGGRGALAAKLAGHTGFVKGVAWDPLNRFIATEVASRIRLGAPRESRGALCVSCAVSCGLVCVGIDR